MVKRKGVKRVDANLEQILAEARARQEAELDEMKRAWEAKQREEALQVAKKSARREQKMARGSTRVPTNWKLVLAGQLKTVDEIATEVGVQRTDALENLTALREEGLAVSADAIGLPQYWTWRLEDKDQTKLFRELFEAALELKDYEVESFGVRSLTRLHECGDNDHVRHRWYGIQKEMERVHGLVKVHISAEDAKRVTLVRSDSLKAKRFGHRGPPRTTRSPSPTRRPKTPN